MVVEQIACHCCDLVMELPEPDAGSRAHCPRCGHLVMYSTKNGYQKAAVFAVCGLWFLLLSLPFPFLAFQSQGREQQVSLIQSGADLIHLGFPELALLLFLFILFIPALLLGTYLVVLLPLGRGFVGRWMYPVVRFLFSLHPWGMAEVFLIGVLVSLVKIAGMADLVIGLSFWAYVLFSIFLILTITSVHQQQLWMELDRTSGICRIPVKASAGSALAQGLQSCHHCGLLHSVHDHHCRRCQGRLHPRVRSGLQKTWAYLLTACVLYLPANLYPIMHTRLFGSDDPSTILGGVVALWQHGSYPIAIVVFVASIVIPVAKMMAIIWLLLGVHLGYPHQPEVRTRMYRLTEFIGRWSMIDVFVVAVLVALVQLGGLISIQPGIATLAFAGVVVLTMLSAMNFDPRLIWDSLSQQEQHAVNCGQESLN
ncbi:PqiA/YebS family transporter subunit [Oceanospirillum sediminis]|uniref:Paraquat-inducible protein A n=1 Tax=Oceanospirillum sediminis TaxID=2760088 RepID=A0A839IQK9_9GAMM|nr:paraquat-inducible protein A [Oceanospirillum sediminis]MBB1487783.1 paraquat-inducible protein A [Oceanospirillum sediminis]